MANTRTGMLGLGLDDEEARQQAQDAADRNLAMQMARMNPDEAVSYQGIRGTQVLGQGVGGLLRGATGSMNAQERMAAARQEIEERTKNIDIKSDPLAVYPIAIEVLQKYGFIEEAMKASADYEKMKRERAEVTRKETKDAQQGEFLKAKAKALLAGGFEAKMAAYADILNKLSDPTIDADSREKLMAMKRGAEAQLGIKDRNGIKVVPATKYGSGGSFQQDSTGDWKWVGDSSMNRTPPPGSGDGHSKPPVGYRWNEDGTALEPIPGGPKDPMSQNGTAKDAETAGNLALLTDLAATFDSSYTGGGYKYMPEAVANAWQELGRRGLNDTPQGEILWWQKYDSWYNQMLHMLSGAAVTASEAKRFAATKVSRGMEPDLAKQTLQQQVEIAKLGLTKLARKQQAGGAGTSTEGKKTVKFGDLK